MSSILVKWPAMAAGLGTIWFMAWWFGFNRVEQLRSEADKLRSTESLIRDVEGKQKLGAEAVRRAEVDLARLGQQIARDEQALVAERQGGAGQREELAFIEATLAQPGNTLSVAGQISLSRDDVMADRTRLAQAIEAREVRIAGWEKVIASRKNASRRLGESIGAARIELSQMQSRLESWKALQQLGHLPGAIGGDEIEDQILQSSSRLAELTRELDGRLGSFDDADSELDRPWSEWSQAAKQPGEFAQDTAETLAGN